MRIEIQDGYEKLLLVKYANEKVSAAEFYVLPEYGKDKVDIREMTEQAIEYLRKGMEDGNQNNDR